MRICVWGGPGSGKSTLAHRLFSHLKIDGHQIEFVNEYIKGWAYEGRQAKSFDQVYIFGKQLHAEYMLLAKGVKNIITECPIMMHIPYCELNNSNCGNNLLEIAKKFDAQYPSMHLFVPKPATPYQGWGRYETEAEATLMSNRILAFLQANCQFVLAPHEEFSTTYAVVVKALAA